MFLGHISEVPNNFKKPLLQFSNKKNLINDRGTYTLMNNICPHQGSLIISKMQNNLSCQYHGWSWNTDGSPLSSGCTKLCNNSSLSKKSVFEINNLLFSDFVDLSSMSHVNLKYMKLVEERIEMVKSNYVNIIDVFLDIDHIPVVHPGVYTQVGVGNSTEVEWKYYDWGNIQLVKKNSCYSKEYQNTLLGIDEEKLSACWITLYPYVTIDWQPGGIFVVICIPKEENTEVIIYKYRDSRYSDDNWKINNTIWETAWQQDKHQAEVIVSKSQLNLEESKIHFRDFLRKT